MIDLYDNPERAEVRNRLIDRLRSESYLPTIYRSDLGPDNFDHVPCFVIDNIQRMLEAIITELSGSQNTMHDFFESYVTDITIPYRDFFMEATLRGIDIAGIRFRALDRDDPMTVDDRAEAFFGGDIAAQQMLDEAFATRARWVLLGEVYYSRRKDCVGPIGGILIEIYDDGHVGRIAHSYETIQGDEEAQEEAICAVEVATMLGVYALCLMSAKNIATISVKPPEKFQRARKKRGKKPLASYIIFRLKQRMRPLGPTAPALEPGRKVRQRVGHFKTYTADQPLFGKYTGKWYWGPIIPEQEIPAGYIVKET